MDWTRSAHGFEGSCIHFFRNSEMKEKPLRRPRRRWKYYMKMSFINGFGGFVLNCCLSEWPSVVTIHEHGNENLSFMKRDEFLG